MRYPRRMQLMDVLFPACFKSKPMNANKLYLLTAVITSATFFSCKKDDAPPKAPEVAPENLISRFSFEGEFSESKTGTVGTGNNASFVTGVRGKAYQGSGNSFISFAQTPVGLSTIQSFTTSMWIKTNKHSNGVQSIFTLPSTSSYLGNMIVMIDQNTGSSDSMQLKVYFEKNVDPAVGWYGQYIDFYGDYRLPNMYGNWRQIAFSYDAATSKFAAYLNGQKLTLEEGMSDRYTDDPYSGGVALGALSFTNVSRFIIGGYQQHLGAPWATPDPEMLTYTGALDELRIYNKALSSTEIQTLYQNELAGN